jgi:hypothetical protein
MAVWDLRMAAGIGLLAARATRQQIYSQAAAYLAVPLRSGPAMGVLAFLVVVVVVVPHL